MKRVYLMTLSMLMADGSWRDEFVAAFESRPEAEKARRGGDELLEHGRIRELKLFESFDEYREDCDNELRESTLAMMTPDQRRVLGLH